MIKNKVFDLLTHLFKKSKKYSDIESAKGQVISLGKKAGLGFAERIMLNNVLSFSSTEVSEAMVPRADIVAVDQNANFKECLSQFDSAAHSRLPVYNGTLDDVVGMVHVKDILSYWNNNENFSLDKIIRKVIISAPSTPISHLFQEMRETKVHLSIVVDEHGGTDGLITIEDMVEEITGEIEDEHDIQINLLKSGFSDGSLIADARILIEDLEKYYNCKLLDDNMDVEIDTLGGLIFHLEGRVPTVGESINHFSGISFEIVEADIRRIKKVKIIGTPKS